MDIAIIGAGLTGLTAGYNLKNDHSVTIYDKSGHPGGLLSSYQRENYSIEKFYHHFFSGDNALIDLLNKTGFESKIIWLSGSTGTLVNGELYPLTTPIEIFKYPHLSFIEKAKLGVFMLKSGRYNVKSLDLITARDFIIANLGEGIYRKFFLPLLKSKFGEAADKVSAAWLVSRVAIRSDRSATGERLGYLQHGFKEFIDALAHETEVSGRILYNTPVTSIERSEDKWVINGESYDKVIVTIPPFLLPESEALPAFQEIPYQGAACVTLALTRDVTNKIYWVNLYDDAKYGAVVAHTNFAPFSWYNEHIIYLASYFSGEVEDSLKELMIADFCHRFKIRDDELLWSEISVDKWAGPQYTTGYNSLLKQPELDGFFTAGMFSEENYPERSIEGSVRAGNRVSMEII